MSRQQGVDVPHGLIGDVEHARVLHGGGVVYQLRVDGMDCCGHADERQVVMGEARTGCRVGSDAAATAEMR